MSHRKVRDPPADRPIDLCDQRRRWLGRGATEDILEGPKQRRALLRLRHPERHPPPAATSNPSKVEAQESEAVTVHQIHPAGLVLIHLDMERGQFLPDASLYGRAEPRILGVSIKRPTALDRAVTPTHFEEQGISLLAGRAFSERDRLGQPMVTVLSDALARRLWPDTNPLGQQLRVGTTSNEIDVVTVVGVVADVRQAPERDPLPVIYRPYAQQPPPWMYIAVDGRVGADRLLDVAREAVWRVDPDTPVDGPWTMSEWIGARTAQPRMVAAVVSTFATVALVLAAVGTLGAMLYMVGLRLREFGIRIALGATDVHVLWTAARQGLIPACLGIGVGLLGATLLGEVLRSRLFGITPTDGWVLGSVALLFGVVALVASLVPAYGATRVDPVQTLRAE